MTPPGPRVVGVNSAQPDDLRWAELADDLRFSALTSLRGRADKWVAGMTALVGTLGLASFIKGPETVAGFASPWDIALPVVLVVAVAAAAISIWMGTTAAQGVEEEFTLTGPEYRERVRTWAEAA